MIHQSIDVLTNAWIDGWINGWLNEWMNGWWMEGGTEWWMDRHIYRWKMGKWVNEQINEQVQQCHTWINKLT